MEQSLFIDLVRRYLPGVAQGVVNYINGTTNPQARRYYHREMLQRQYSIDLTWNSIINVNGGMVAADVVAMDSELPRKTRDSLNRANGEIPKLGMELALNEKQLTELDILERNPNQVGELVRRIFEDTPRCINGVYERLEYEFLQGLSSGIALVPDTANVGTAIRVDYGYLAQNKFFASTVWSNVASATPISDINEGPVAKAVADGNVVTVVMLDRVTMNYVLQTDEAKQLWAAQIAFFGANIPAPTVENLNQATQARFGWVFEVVDRKVFTEKNGVQSPQTPWAAGQVVCLADRNRVGNLVWGTLAEMNHPVQNVTYQTVDQFILLSKYRVNSPLREFTSSQALALPVIQNVNRIYTLNSTATS